MASFEIVEGESYYFAFLFKTVLAILSFWVLRMRFSCSSSIAARKAVESITVTVHERVRIALLTTLTLPTQGHRVSR